MLFKPKNFVEMNEQDVREDIITPLLHQLGYEKGTENNIIREYPLQLRYNKESLGRQKPKTDPPIRGKADYVLDIKNKIRWVIEAKPPTNHITESDVSQAYTYAKHPEIRAVLFCLCNGKEFNIYRTDSLPESALIYSVSYEDLEAKLDEILNILSPNAMCRNWQDFEIDTGKPISKNLGSIAKIIGGEYKYLSSSLPDEVIKEFNFTVKSGEITRDKNGKLVGNIIIRSPVVSAQDFIKLTGQDSETFSSSDSEISTVSSKPTVFISSSLLTYLSGTTILGYKYTQDVEYKIETILKGHLENLTLKGVFNGIWKTDFPNGSFKTSGVFEIYLR